MNFIRVKFYSMGWMKSRGLFGTMRENYHRAVSRKTLPVVNLPNCQENYTSKMIEVNFSFRKAPIQLLYSPSAGIRHCGKFFKAFFSLSVMPAGNVSDEILETKLPLRT